MAAARRRRTGGRCRLPDAPRTSATRASRAAASPRSWITGRRRSAQIARSRSIAPRSVAAASSSPARSSRWTSIERSWITSSWMSAAILARSDSLSSTTRPRSRASRAASRATGSTATTRVMPTTANQTTSGWRNGVLVSAASGASATAGRVARTAMSPAQEHRREPARAGQGAGVAPELRCEDERRHEGHRRGQGPTQDRHDAALHAQGDRRRANDGSGQGKDRRAQDRPASRPGRCDEPGEGRGGHEDGSGHEHARQHDEDRDQREVGGQQEQRRRCGGEERRLDAKGWLSGEPAVAEPDGGRPGTAGRPRRAPARSARGERWPNWARRPASRGSPAGAATAARPAWPCRPGTASLRWRPAGPRPLRAGCRPARRSRPRSRTRPGSAR